MIPKLVDASRHAIRLAAIAVSLALVFNHAPGWAAVVVSVGILGEVALTWREIRSFEQQLREHREKSSSTFE